MRSNLLLVFVFFSFTAHAQKEKKVTVVPERFATIPMAKLPIAEFPENAIRVSGIRVIQRLADSVRMGYTVKGIVNAVATLKFSKPLTEVLQEQVKRMYKHEFKKEGAEILWVVKNLRFAERSGAADYSYTRFNADSYISNDGKLYKKTCAIDTVLVVVNGGGHGSDVENAFRILLRRTLQADKELSEQTAAEQTIEQITEEATRRLDIPILIDTAYREGAYASFEEFLQNKPSITDYEPLIIEKKKIKFARLGKDTPKAAVAIWGLCKDGKIYKYYEEMLIPIDRDGYGFTISNYVQATTKKNNDLASAGFIGAFVGGLPGIAISLSAGLSAEKPMLVKSLKYIDDPEAQPIATCIDMKTGEFTF